MSDIGYEAIDANIRKRGGTIPNAVITISSAITSTTTANALGPCAGKWVTLRARTSNITFRRGTATLVAGQGMTLNAGESRDFYVSRLGSLDLSHIANLVGTLEIHYDSET